MTHTHGRKRQARRKKPDVVALKPLIDALWERPSTDSIDGWLSVGWKTVQAPIQLLIAWHQRLVSVANRAGQETRDHALAFLEKEFLLPIPVSALEGASANYWKAKFLVEQLTATRPAVGDQATVCLIEALEIAQRYLSNSHSNGDLYNIHIKRAFQAIHSQNLEDRVNVKASILAWRINDVVDNPYDQKRRKAFTLAWEQGLYQLAYCV